MKTQKLTLSQLKDLYESDDCIEWKKVLKDYIAVYYMKKDNDAIELKQKDIDYAKQHCSKKQLQLLIDAGLVFEKEFTLADLEIGKWAESDYYFWKCVDKYKGVMIMSVYDKESLNVVSRHNSIKSFKTIKAKPIKGVKIIPIY